MYSFSVEIFRETTRMHRAERPCPKGGHILSLNLVSESIINARGLSTGLSRLLPLGIARPHCTMAAIAVRPDIPTAVPPCTRLPSALPGVREPHGFGTHPQETEIPAHPLQSLRHLNIDNDSLKS